MACHYKPYHTHYAKKGVNHSLEQSKSALLIVNVQKAFLPGGSIGILNGRPNANDQSLRMINTINMLIESDRFDHHIYVQDAHHPDHVAFASSHSKEPFEVVALNYDDKPYQQMLWPGHCRIDGQDSAPQSLTDNTTSASGIELADELINPNDERFSNKSKVFNVGEDNDIDSYSAFKNYLGKDTGLHRCLLQLNVKNVYVCGIARDFASWWTTLDATTYVNPDTKQSIFDASLIWDATLPAPGSLELAEYDSKSNIQSPHHDALSTLLSRPDRTIEGIMNALLNADPHSNRWVQCYLNSYGAQGLRASDILNRQPEELIENVPTVAPTSIPASIPASISASIPTADEPSTSPTSLFSIDFLANLKQSMQSSQTSELPDTEIGTETETIKITTRQA